MNAIQTSYKGAKFRSRLEAKWAAFFDLAGWRWEYEPLDLEGYIPDFILQFHQPLLVEVKPELKLPALEQYCKKIEQCGWNGGVLIVGAATFGDEIPKLGLVGEHGDFGEGLTWIWDDAEFFQCLECKAYSFAAEVQSFECRVCGVNKGGDHRRYLERFRVDYLWRAAGNQVRWEPKGGFHA